MSTGHTCSTVWGLEGPGPNLHQRLLAARLWNKGCSDAMVRTPRPLLVAVLTSTVNFMVTGMKQIQTKDILPEGDSWVIQTTNDSRLRGCGEAGFPED